MAVKLMKVGNYYNTNAREYWIDTDDELSTLPIYGVPTFSLAISGLTGKVWYFAGDGTWKQLPVTWGTGGSVTPEMFDALRDEILREIENAKEVKVSVFEPQNPNVTLWLNPYATNEYTIPSVSDGVTSNMDTWSSNKINSEINKRIDDMVIVSDDYPITENNKIWIKKTTEEIEIPTMDDISDIQEGVSDIRQDITRIDTKNTEQDERLNTIESYIRNGLYQEKVDNVEAYFKSIDDNVFPYASVDMIGGKTLKYGQIALDEYIVFRSSVYGNFVPETHTIVWKSDYNNHLSSYQVQGRFGSTANHVYLFQFFVDDVVWRTENGYHRLFIFGANRGNINSTTWQAGNVYSYVISTPTDRDHTVTMVSLGNSVGTWVEGDSTEITLRICMYDLTYIFGEGNEPSDYQSAITAFNNIGVDITKYRPPFDNTVINATAKQVVSSTGDTLDLSTISAKYFPDGMRSAGDVYDEINLKYKQAIKRVGVDGDVLADPVITDITEDIDNFINVEPNGTLTFVSLADGQGFKLPVPNQETYIVNVGRELGL